MRLRNLHWFAWLLICFVTLAACQRNVTPDDLVNKNIDELKVPPDKSAMIGSVISKVTGEPLALYGVRLAKVFWFEGTDQGAYVLDGGSSPGDDTDENGVFIFNDLEPADYVIIVGDVIGYNDVVTDSDGKARVFKTEPGQVLKIEPLYVNLPK